MRIAVIQWLNHAEKPAHVAQVFSALVALRLVADLFCNLLHWNGPLHEQPVSFTFMGYWLATILWAAVCSYMAVSFIAIRWTPRKLLHVPIGRATG